MNFDTAKDAYRYYSVTGFDSADHKEFLYLSTLNELGAYGFMDFEEELAKEVDRGMFLSPPPKFVS